MESKLYTRLLTWLSFILMFIQTSNEAFASHAQSADITYKCLGGNQYEISLSFYRDCAGVAAPGTATINLSSASCGQNFNTTLNQIPGTGIDVSPLCASAVSLCSGGTYPGVQEYIYRGIVTLPMSCTDWVFSFSLCCRNATIGTIVSPSSESIYVEAHLDNLNFPCNNSPTFSNNLVPFACVGQPYCFNNGASDVDGDSLYYTLIAPETSPTTTVTYIAPYSATQPLASSPLVSFNQLTGDMCATPTMIEVTVFAILVQEYRAEVLVGSVMRDVQMRTMTCTNTNPYVNGMNNTGTYSLTACAGVPINFNINAFDVDSGQTVSLSWNAGIAAASFISSGGALPTGTFSWTPTAADISSVGHCFTVTVQDDNCPYNGSQTYSFCITVTGIVLGTTSTPANCGLPNGTASVQILAGTGPFTYQWLPGGATGTTSAGLSAGAYTINVTGSGGCTSSANVTVPAGATPAVVNATTTPVSCYAGNNGTANANATGGAAPYTYSWSSGSTAATVSSLMAGVYTVAVTTSNGCVTHDTIAVTQPASPLTFTLSQTNVNCNGSSDGTATIVVAGGTGPYSYLWNTTPLQTTAAAINLNAALHSIVVTDNNGCVVSASVSITQPPALNVNTMIIHNVTCNGFADGYATVGASGGIGIYNYMWSTTPATLTQTVSGLSPGNYTATVTDANGCSSASTITITQPAALTISSAGFPTSCYGSSNGQGIVIPAGGSPTYTYQWMPSGGTGASATGLVAGIYTATTTDANGCTASATITITQPGPVVTSAIGSTTICSGQNTVITASATGGSGSYTYNWTGVGTGASQTVSPSANTTYNVIATDALGCIGNIANVTVNVTSLTAANLTVSSGAIICVGNSSVISSNVFGSTGPVTISWSSGLGSGNGPFTVSPTSSTTYVVTVTDACGNSVYGYVPVTVNPLPVINISPQSVVSCSQATLNFVDYSTTNTGAQYMWSFGDGSISNQTNPVHDYTSSGTYTVTVVVTSPAGCVNTANTTNTVVVNPGTFAQFSANAIDGTIISPSYIFNDASVNAATHYWTFGDGTNSSTISPQHTYAAEGIYTVTLYTTTTAGCRDSVSTPVEIKPVFTIYIPNAFTPDGDGTNDYFSAKGADINEFDMMVFDRWGELIFQTNDMQKGWDGKANHGNDIAETGVYVYKIAVRDFENRYHNYSGHITLLASK